MSSVWKKVGISMWGTLQVRVSKKLENIFFFFAGRKLEKCHSFTKGYGTKLCAATGFKKIFFSCDGLKKNLGFKTYEYQTGWFTAADIRASKSFFQLQSARKKNVFSKSNIKQSGLPRKQTLSVFQNHFEKTLLEEIFERKQNRVQEKKRISKDLTNKQILLFHCLTLKKIDKKFEKPAVSQVDFVKKLCQTFGQKQNKS